MFLERWFIFWVKNVPLDLENSNMMLKIIVFGWWDSGSFLFPNFLHFLPPLPNVFALFL